MKAKGQINFRMLEKETVGLSLPTPVVSALRESSAKTRRSLNYIVTEAVCNRLGQDPSKYGIEARKPKSSAVA